MNEAPLEAWVAKADEDSRAASALDPEDVPDVICFLCQQCIEKYLKAALVYHSVVVPKIHNLIVLNDLVTEGEPGFRQFDDRLDILNRYAVITRYPGFEITPDDAREAVQVMQELRAQTRKLLGLEAE
ncbi:MAG: HEPN domain-containing protein [Armatimonadota bacterium]|jgi:HEPN domain-containing protein